MKPTIGNLRKLAGETDDLAELQTLKDHVAFYIAGLKMAADWLGRPVNAIETLLDDARRTEEVMVDRIQTLKSS